MTDEEKAIEYVLNTYYAKYVTEKEKIFLCDEIKFNDRMKINAYLAGLEEGRKELKKENAELKKQIEHMVCFIQSQIGFCSYCPLTKECRNDNSVCPYNGVTDEEKKQILMDYIGKLEPKEIEVYKENVGSNPYGVIQQENE